MSPLNNIGIALNKSGNNYFVRLTAYCNNLKNK